MVNYTILLPPSEGKKSGGNDSKVYRLVKNLKKYNSFNYLEIERDFVYNKLREALSELSEKQLEKVFELKGDNLNRAVENLSDFLNLPTLKAIERYEGVMFKSIDYENMSKKQQLNFDSSILFIDGMFGVLKPTDLIPEYKLKISSKFLDISIKNYWKERLYGTFREQFKNKIVIDILPQAHREVVSYSSNENYYQISFKEEKKGKIQNVGHNSKKLKGEFVNYLVSKDNIDEKYITSFTHSEGYKYSKELSSDNEIVFFKK